MSSEAGELIMADIIKKKKLLIVDDHLVNLAILKKILETDYDIITAVNGKIALDILNLDHENSICGVVLDIVMPVMDGYEVLRRMRADKKLAGIPVIVASGNDDTNENNTEVLALSLGANDFVTKPYKPEIIKHRIANTIYLRETAAFVNTVQHDALTGIYSKEYFYMRAEEILKNSNNQKYDMVCCDIERFKLVNDLYGTDIGDELLKHCAKIFVRYTENHGICGRIGPDVFAFLIIHQENYDNNIFTKVNEIVNDFHINLNIILRYGIYVVEDTNVPANIMCDRACLAKASIKGLYDTHYKYYDTNIREKLLNEQYITSNMKKALEENQFEVYFQPKYEIKSEKIVGAEALVRWNNPEKGFMSPGDFIPLFEKNGFITDLDIYVWETCCKKIREWIDLGNKAVPISVNVSRADIYNPNIHNILLSLIKKYHLSPKYIYLEITESAYTENSQQLIEAVERLKKLGFLIEMDDFGTGYSSLNMLSELPIDILKLDIGFMQNQAKQTSRSILSFIVSLAKWLNLGIIAEGVETAEQLSLLRSLNCECAQGYYYAKPMPSKDFEELLLKQFAENHIEKIASSGNLENISLSTYHVETIIIIDEDYTIYENFKHALDDKYTVIHGCSNVEITSKLDYIKDDVTAVFFAWNGKATITDLENLVIGCGVCNIPVIAVNIPPKEMDNAISIGISDCITEPYSAALIKVRIENAVCKSRISEFEKEKEINSAILEMKKRAEQDSLTGLLNRAEFENRIQEFFHQNDNPEGVFIMLDVDNFKSINDTYGHATGDNVLQSIASALHYIFPETSIIGRMGGDEFALFIPYSIQTGELKLKTQKLCNALDFDIDSTKISCSAGICISPKYGLDFHDLYRNADTALLFAKRNGKGQYKFYKKDMIALFDERLEEKASSLLNNSTDAMFVCDAVSSEIIYINDTACNLIHKDKKSCIGARCYQLFWEKCKNCDRCYSIGECVDHFYEEDTFMKDGKTRIHIKAKTDTWDGRKVKIHYLHSI